MLLDGRGFKNLRTKTELGLVDLGYVKIDDRGRLGLGGNNDNVV